MRTRALWRFNETVAEQRPIDAIGAVAELNQSPIEFGTPDALRRAIGWGQWQVGWHFNELAGNLNAAFGGTALVPLSSPLYGLAGVHPGDRSIGFDSAADAFSGGDVYDITDVDDFGFAWAGQWVAAPGNEMIVGKDDYISNPNARWDIYTDTGSIRMSTVSASGVVEASVAVAALVGLPHVGIGVVSRNPGKSRVAVRSLSGISVVSPEASPFAETMANAAPFLIGARLGAQAPISLRLMSAYLGVGPGAMSGLSANLGTAIENFANAVSSAVAVVDAAAGRGRSFVALSGHGLEAADVVSGDTLLTRNCSVQALVRWDLQDQAAATSWDITGITGDWNVEGSVGLSSLSTLEGDGYLEFSAVNGGQWYQVGLTPSDTTTTFAEPGVRAIMLRQDGTDDYHVRLSGGAEATFVGPWLTTDVWRIQRVGTTMTFYRNGALLHTSVTPSSGPLRIDITALATNASVTNLILVSAGQRIPITWQKIINCNPTPTIHGTLYARGKATSAAEYLGAGVELRVVNAAQGIGELAWLWQDTAGVLKRQVGGHFAPPADGYLLLTATRRWVSSTKVILRYFLGGRMLAEIESVDGDIGGGDAGTTSIGARFDGTKWGDFFDGVIDELQVVDYELAPDEVAAIWERITKGSKYARMMGALLPPGKVWRL